MENTTRLIPIGAMARILGVTARWLRAEAEAGRIPSLHAGKQILVDRKTVDRLTPA